MDTKLSLIIPVFNAEAFIIDSLIRLTEWGKKTSYSVQIILVDDGSKDSTKSIVENYIKSQDSTIEIISHKVNRGKGYAVKTGMLSASGKYRIFTDDDIPYGFEVFDIILDYLDSNEFDVVVGDRTLLGSSYVRKIPLIRKVGSSIFSCIVGRFVANGHFDTQCGIKGFSGAVAEDLFSVSKINRFAFDVEILFISQKRNYSIKRLPVVLSCQEGSSLRVFSDGLLSFIDIFRIKLNQLKGNYIK